MEPEALDWNNVESFFVEDDTYENLNAPKWVDFFAPDVAVVDDAAWFCNPDCKHPKTAEDFMKPPRTPKVKLLRSVTISEMLPFRDRSRSRSRRDAKLKREEIPSGQTGKSNGCKSENNFSEESENKNPNVSSPPLAVHSMWKKALTKSYAEKTKHQPLDDGSHANSTPKPLLRSAFSARNLLTGKAGRGRKAEGKSNGETNQQQLDDLRAHSSSRRGLRSAFSARNLGAGKDILSQITEFCSELKKLGKKCKKKGPEDKASDGLTGGQVRERVGDKERMPLLEVKGKGDKALKLQ